MARGIGPAPAIQNALKRADLKLSDMDLVEVNEAFAPQYLAVEKELGLDRAKTNVNGGAIALGHPLGASGARITTHLVYELARRGGKYAGGSAGSDSAYRAARAAVTKMNRGNARRERATQRSSAGANDAGTCEAVHG